MSLNDPRAGVFAVSNSYAKGLCVLLAVQRNQKANLRVVIGCTIMGKPAVRHIVGFSENKIKEYILCPKL